MGMRTLLCRLGWHSGQWSYPGSRCEVVRTCDSCGKTAEQTRHDWGPFTYPRAGDCVQLSRCLRCGATQSRSAHDWGPWVYANTEFNSPQVRTCRRCHETERTSYTVR